MKKILFIFLMGISLMLVSCQNHDFYRTSLIDEYTGSFEIPINWVIELNNGWNQIVNLETNEIIAIQYDRGDNNGHEINPYFEAYEYVESEAIRISSTSAYFSLYTFTINTKNQTFYSIEFSADQSYTVQLLFLNDDVPEETFLHIIKSYRMTDV